MEGVISFFPEISSFFSLFFSLANQIEKPIDGRRKHGNLLVIDSRSDCMSKLMICKKTIAIARGIHERASVSCIEVNDGTWRNENLSRIVRLLFVLLVPGDWLYSGGIVWCADIIVCMTAKMMYCRALLLVF